MLRPQEQTWEGPREASVELLPLGRSSCPLSHSLSTIQFWLVTGQVPGTVLGDAGCLARLKARDLLYLLLGKQAAISDFSRCERSLSCESLRGEHGNTNITSSEN